MNQHIIASFKTLQIQEPHTDDVNNDRENLFQIQQPDISKYCGRSIIFFSLETLFLIQFTQTKF